MYARYAGNREARKSFLQRRLSMAKDVHQQRRRSSVRRTSVSFDALLGGQGDYQGGRSRGMRRRSSAIVQAVDHGFKGEERRGESCTQHPLHPYCAAYCCAVVLTCTNTTPSSVPSFHCSSPFVDLKINRFLTTNFLPKPNSKRPLR